MGDVYTVLPLGPPHDKTPATVTTNKNIKVSSFKSRENIQKKEVGPYRPVSKFRINFDHTLLCFGNAQGYDFDAMNRYLLNSKLQGRHLLSLRKYRSST